MTAVRALRSVACGERPNGEFLPPCRLEALGSEFYGEEAIVHCFRGAPLAISQHATLVECEGHLAIFEEETALIADVSGDAVLRLWRLGPGQVAEAEPAIGVPFDADLVQARGDLAMRAEDHPALAPGAVQHVETIGQGVSRDWSAEDGSAPYRSRSFLIRAFSQGDVGVALFAVYTLGPAAVRTAGFSYAAAIFQIEGSQLVTHRIVRDRAGEAAVAIRSWTPRV